MALQGPLGAQSSRRQQKPPCEPNLAACPDEGCGKQFDPNLNVRKNIRSDDRPATPETLTWMQNLPNPKHFTKGGSREELTALGEGQKLTVVAYVIAAKQEGAESCNCGLTSKPETDNHLVLVTKATVSKYPVSGDPEANKKTFHQREVESETAEFTPRVRLDHPNFTHEKLQPLVNRAAQKALLVRVTGRLLFDSEHFVMHPLVRVNNWEVHPILKLEVCTEGDGCEATGDAGWKSLDDIE